MKLTTLLIFLWSTQLAAQSWILEPGIYLGTGFIQEKQVELSCTYDIKLTIGEAAPGELYIIRDIIYHNPLRCDFQSSSNFVIENTGNNFYNVIINGFTAEHGFCSDSFCMHHLSYTNGTKVTEGIYKNGESYSLSGMSTSRSNLVKVWSADLQKKS